MARIVVAGCGYVGCTLATTLVAQGHSVWGLRRHPHEMPDGVVPVAADLCDRTQLSAALPPDIDYIYLTMTADAHDTTAYHRAYLTSIKTVLEVLEQRPSVPQHMFFTSSTGVYGQHDGQWVDETTPANPSRETATILLDAENALLSHRIPASVIRLSGIYGPGRTRLIDGVRSATSMLHEEPSAWTNRIHRDDCAGFLAHLLNVARKKPVYIGSDNQPERYNTVLKWIAAALRMRLPPATETSTKTEKTRIRGLNKRCKNSELQSSGYVLNFPSYREGYGALMEHDG